MSRSVYLTALGPASGKSIVALGLVDVLSRRVGRVAFFRPIVQSVPDNDIELIKARYQLADEDVGHVFTVHELRALVSGDREVADTAMARAVAAGRELEARCDVVVIEGTDFTGPSSPVEFDMNTRVARHLGAPVVAVVNGYRQDVAAVLERVEVSEESLLAQGATVLAVVVNRVRPAVLPAVQQALAGRGDARCPAWALPENDTLRHPTLAELGEALAAEVVAGEQADLLREVRHVKVAAMSVPNLLDHVEDGTVFIAAGDRPDVIVTAALTRLSAACPSVAGLILSGGLRPDARIRALIGGLGEGARPLPMLVVADDTFETANAAARVEGAITPGNTRKIDLALDLFEQHVDVVRLEEGIELTRSTVVTPVMFQYDLIERAKAAKAHIVLPEGSEDRILEAADRLARRHVCQLTLLGPQSTVGQRIAELNLDLADATVVDPLDSPWRDVFARRYCELRAHKGVTLELASDLMTDPSFFGTMMVHEGLADGMVSGAVNTTAHTIRPALEFIRTKPDTSIVSSVFFMLLADRVLVYGDCAVIPDPDAKQLADIAVSSAATAQLFGIEPRVAMLSYSTGASGSGSDVEKVREATARVRALRPDLMIDGPIQYDAAVDASVARAKLPDSLVAGRATVFIFPDLNTGNNTYKAVQRSAGAVAVGPVLQGLNRPVNDLSRGATVTDIVNTVAITAIQTGAS